MKFPELLDGTATGQVHYKVDNDDPSTLSGEGHFEILNGRFSADVLAQLFKEQLTSEKFTLPPSLEFSRLSADIGFNGDTVTTKNILLESKDIKVTGEGNYVSDGDMHYSVQVSISPEAAQRMPALLKHFNIKGHQLTRNNIKLAFSIDGPTFHPSGAVTKTPSVYVTLVSGAGEMADQVVNALDTPRQILIDLVKIFGGIVGPGKGSLPIK